MKKILTVVFAVALLVLAMSTMAFADGNVAQIGETQYATLQEAVNEAQSGATIELLGDTTGSGVKINKSLTIDFGTYTYTANSAVGSTGTASQAFQILSNNGTPYDVTLKNGTIAVTDGVNLKVVIMNYSNLTLENMTLDGTGSSVMMYGLVANNGTSALTGSTSIKVADEAVALDVDGSQKSYGEVDIRIDTTGKIEGKVDIYGDEASVVIDNGTFDGEFATTADTTINGGTFSQQVAKIGEKTYPTLQSAVDAAESEAVITLLGDTTGSGVKINKGITIDFGGYTYTANSAVGSKGTESQAFQILYGEDKTNPCDVTLKNGTIAVTEGVNLKVVIMNYSNLTLENMTLDGTGSSVMMYGMSTNNGTSSLTGNTSIKVADGAVALDVDGSQKSYGAVDIEINTTGTIEGKVDIYGEEVSADVAGGTFTDVDGVKGYLADTDMLVEQGDGTYVVGEKEDWTTATDSGYYTDNGTDYGMMRFLFKNNTDKAVKEVGIKYIYTSETEKNSFSAGKEFKVETDKKAFYGDVAGIASGNNNTYYAIGYVKYSDDTVEWSEVVECSVNWNRYFKDYAGGAN